MLPQICAAADQLPDFETVGLLPESKAVCKKLVRPTKQTIEEFMELEGSEFPVSSGSLDGPGATGQRHRPKCKSAKAHS